MPDPTDSTFDSLPEAAPGDASLARLLDLARDGDEAAQERLFAVCRNYVAVLARAKIESWMRAKVDASDLCQQTMLEAVRGLGDFRGTTPHEWLAWLRTVLHRNELQFVRAHRQTDKRQIGREMRLVPDDGSDAGGAYEPPAAGPGPSTIFIVRQDELRLADAIAALPPDYQDVIMLRHVERLAFDEVARRMGRSLPAVQMMWLRALRRLRQTMEP
jgi:RNA polymerase sigma-70 factor, ECF subfamily